MKRCPFREPADVLVAVEASEADLNVSRETIPVDPYVRTITANTC